MSSQSVKKSEPSVDQKDDKKEILKQPTTIEIIKAPVLQIETTDKTEKHHDYASSEWWLVYLTGVLAAATIGLFIFTACLFKATVALGDDAKESGQRQASEMKESLRISKISADSAKKSADTSMLSERAYITASVVLPGLKWINASTGLFEVHIAIMNHGRTPGNVTDVAIGSKILENGEQLGNTDIAAREVIPKAFLVPNDSLPHSRNFNINGQSINDVKTGNKTLWVFGYIDYVDIFHMRRRSGFARIYQPRLDDNKQINLVRMTEGNFQYDYDRQHEDGEGNN
ncbi:hypothetical protein [Undibacterium sp. RuTC16W]|uniref:hypothetical protein n=1 Tax=Undibacterium sp. RuTC16W TaxID=3413048 RepID=UPI003BF30D71